MKVAERIGRFTIQGQVGAGMMGVVFKALDTSTGQPVAIKVLRAPDIRLAARFEREAKILAHLDAPEIVAYIDSGTTDDGEAYIAMEWVDGETLKDRLERGGMPYAEVIDIVARITSAVGKAHQVGIVHRDLKPANIVLGSHPPATLKVLDFGVARFRSGDESLTGTGDMVGTPAYMSPEQARGLKELDGRSDLYAIGCILFRCVTGRHTFEAQDAFSALLKLATERAPPVRSVTPSVPAKLADLIDRLLQQSPSDRPPDAAAVAAELQVIRATLATGLTDIAAAPALPADATLPSGAPSFGEHRPVASRSAAPAHVTVPPPTRRRVWLWLAAGIAAASGLVVAGIFLAPALGWTAKPAKKAPPKPPTAPSVEVSSAPLGVVSTVPPPISPPVPTAEVPHPAFVYKDRNGALEITSFDCNPVVQHWAPQRDLGRLTERQLATCSDKRGYAYVSITDTLDNMSVGCEYAIEAQKPVVLKALSCAAGEEKPISMGPVSGTQVVTLCANGTSKADIRFLCDPRLLPQGKGRTFIAAILRRSSDWSDEEAARYFAGYRFQ